MKISYNWLKDYLNFDLNIEKTSEILTDIGLEVEGVEQFETVKGSLNGVVIGEVKELQPHPDADRLQLTKIDVGQGELLDIVCGAPNVAKGQKVVVALVGCTLYPNEEGFKIKKSKIRGAVSEGMLCAEDELGLGESHDGIMVLESDAAVGMPAAEYFKLESDTVFEIGLTPNRIDAASHYGVARDLAAFLSQEQKVELKKGETLPLKVEGDKLNIEVSIEDEKACPRYSGITISNLTVAASPDWLQNRLKAIGLKPINNVVDVTNYVLHEIGQPLHAFDAAKIKGNKVIVKKIGVGTIFTTLDEVERKLSAEDLMICNAEDAMCIAGVFGGVSSGVTENTKSIFLESAYFDAVGVRKTAKRHGLNTDASFRYERGTDPNITIFALERAAYLLQKVAGGKISSELFDHYPKQVEDCVLELNYENCFRLVGQEIESNQIKQILESLEIKILDETESGLRLQVPAYRVDVNREVDVIEEVLRIYGYNRIELPEQMKMAMIPKAAKDSVKIENTIADYLSSNGFSEIFNNSLSNPSYYAEQDDLIKMLNPLSKETEVMRKSMVYGGLEAISYNINRKRKNLKFYEFGKTYRKADDRFDEKQQLAFWMTGEKTEESWQTPAQAVDFFELKSFVLNTLQRVGVANWKSKTTEAVFPFSSSLTLLKGKRVIGRIGKLSKSELQKFDIKEEVFYAELDWTLVLELIDVSAVEYKKVTKFPAIRRDLALLIDSHIQFQEIEALAKKTATKLLKSINLFDVYEGENLPEGKKSYAVSFTFQDEQKTLTDKQIDKVMERLIASLKENIAAELR